MGPGAAEVNSVFQGEVGAHAAWRSGALIIVLPAPEGVWGMILGGPKAS